MSSLLEHYEEHLHLVHERQRDFAEKHPAIADRLGLSRDPHVERLTESVAYLAAHIALSIDDQYCEASQALVGLVYPHYLRPVPAMAIAQFDADPAGAGQAAGYVVDRGAQMETALSRGCVCTFRTVYPVSLWPLRVSAAGFERPTSDMPGLSAGDDAVVHLELSTLGGARLGTFDGFDRLRFHLDGEARVTHALYETLMARRARLLVRRPDGETASAELHDVGFGSGGDEGVDAAIPYERQSFAGFRLLQEYFALPEKFLFFDVSGLAFARGQAASERFEIFIVLSGVEQRERLAMLQSQVNADTFRLACTPVVNLMDMPAEPIALTHRQSAYRIAPRVGREEDFEVYSINSVSSQPEYGKDACAYLPFYGARHTSEGRQFWYATRRPSQRKDDPGTDVYLSFVDLDCHPAALPREAVTVRLTCTNRNRTDRLLVQGNRWGLTAPLGLRARFLAQPTPARRPPLSGELQWRLVSHIALNSFAVVIGGRDALAEMLKLYDFSGEAVDVERRIAGLRAVESGPAALPVPLGAGVAFCRGTTAALTFDESKYPSGNAFLTAMVLDRFLGLLAPVNSFSQVTARSLQREAPIMQWPARSGKEVLC